MTLRSGCEHQLRDFDIAIPIIHQVKDDVGPCWAMIHVKNSLMFGGAGDSICVYRGYVPEWLLAETERKQAEQYAKESAGPYDDPFDFVRDSYDPTASAMAVFGKPGGTSSRELAEPRRSQGSSLPPVEFCDSPPVTRTMMMS